MEMSAISVDSFFKTMQHTAGVKNAIYTLGYHKNGVKSKEFF